MIERRTLAGLALSASALVGILMHEGYSDKAYAPVKGDVPTIGFGTTGGVKMGDTIKPPQAVARALGDVHRYDRRRLGLHRAAYRANASMGWAQAVRKAGGDYLSRTHEEAERFQRPSGHGLR